MIKELNDLIHFLKTSIWQDKEVLAFITRDNPDLLLLYRRLWEQGLNSDHAAATAAGIGLTSFKKQARMLRRSLQQMLVFYNAEKAKADVAAKNLAEGTIELALLRLLQTREYQHAPIALAKRLFRRGKDYDLPVFVLEALRVKKAFALHTGANTQEYEEYATAFREYQVYVAAEEQAADCFQRLQLAARYKKIQRQEALNQIGQRLRKLEHYKGVIPSSQFHVHFYTVQGNCFLETAEYAAALDCFDEAIMFFQTKKYPSNSILAEFYGSRVQACMLLGLYSEGATSALSSLDHTENGSARFFKAYERYFYLAMHTAHYSQALEIFQTVCLHKRFSQLKQTQQEGWRIMGAYLFVLYRMKAWEWPEQTLSVYRSGRFANETASLSKDKRGMNIAIQIVLVLLMLLEGRDDDVLDRLAGLEKYRSRYLQEPGTERSKRIIRLLCQLPRLHFKANGFLQKSKPVLVEIAGFPRQLTNQNQELEVLPFEALVEALAAFLHHRSS